MMPRQGSTRASMAASASTPREIERVRGQCGERGKKEGGLHVRSISVALICDVRYVRTILDMTSLVGAHQRGTTDD